jgi:hypothetical protein
MMTGLEKKKDEGKSWGLKSREGVAFNLGNGLRQPQGIGRKVQNRGKIIFQIESITRETERVGGGGE